MKGLSRRPFSSHFLKFQKIHKHPKKGPKETVAQKFFYHRQKPFDEISN